MSAVAWVGYPWPNYPEPNFSWTVQTADGTGNITWTSPNTGGAIPVTYTGQPFLPQNPLPTINPLPQFTPIAPNQSDKERTERLCDICASSKIYLRKSVAHNGCNAISVNIEINDTPPPTSDFIDWEKSVVLFNTSVNGSNISRIETDALVKTFASMLTALGTRVIIDGQEFDPQ